MKNTDYILAENKKLQNIGDYLATVIYKYMLDYYHLDKDKKVKKTTHLYTVGSIILLGHQDAVIWGSGILMREPEGLRWKRNRYRKLDIRCVRGPLTKQRLKENGYNVENVKFGDPAILMPLFYKPKEGVKREYSVILHKSSKYKTANEIPVMTENWKKTIDQIYNSKLVISSSLHGIILAESYGIPAILLDTVEFDDLFKYEDYYLSTGRKSFSRCHTVEEGLKIPVPPVPDLSSLQKDLIESFPKDFWEDRKDKRC